MSHAGNHHIRRRGGKVLMNQKGTAGLSALYFLQFAIWGCYLTCLGQLLGAGGLGKEIAWFYAAVGFVSLVMPALAGHLADRYISSSRLLGLCHLLASFAMFGAWLYAESHPRMEFSPFFTIYVAFLAFYMPTLALINATTFAIMKGRGIRPVDVFPRIRIWGTVGFVAAMWFVNSAYWHNGVFGMTWSELNPFSRYRFQYTPMMLLCASALGLVMSLYTLTLPAVPVARSGVPMMTVGTRKGRGLFRVGYVRTFLLLAVLSGVCLQITNGFATPFISHFMGVKEYTGSAVAGNATMLFSLSQISEAACVLLVGVCMKRFGIRAVMVMALTAWSLRFLLFAFGNPGDGLWMLVASMLVYGIAFNFFSIAGHIYMDQCTDESHRALGQGMLMFMTNGIGASVGTIAAGAVVNSFCHWEMTPVASGDSVRLFMGDWIWPWLIFGFYALLVALLYLFCFHPRTTKA